MPSAHLPPHHYASRWETDKEFKTPEQITELGIEYFTKPEGTDKEALLLELLQSFHGYTTKYLHMILRGHVPYYAGTINDDAKNFLLLFLPAGTEANRTNLLNACRTLHFAFKGAEAGEIYDILVMCLLRAINKWDPYYTDKVRKVVDVISDRFPQKQFTAFQLNSELGFDGTRIARMLARRKFLEKVPDPQPGKPGMFKRNQTNWPPPAEWFQKGPVGLVYFASQWFRYYLQQHITSQMNEVEATEDIMQLEHRRLTNSSFSDNYLTPRANELNIPSAEGQMTDSNGDSWLCDISLLTASMDLADLNLKWVEASNDPLFAALSRQERYLLYLLYGRDLGWKEAGASLDISAKKAKELYSQIITKLQRRADTA
jgi:hypothetical protein